MIQVIYVVDRNWKLVDGHSPSLNDFTTFISSNQKLKYNLFIINLKQLSNDKNSIRYKDPPVLILYGETARRCALNEKTQ